MILQVRKLKLRSFFLLFPVLTVASLGQASSARAQGSFFGDPLTPSFGSRTGQILGTVYLDRSAEPAPQVVVNVRSLSSAIRFRRLARTRCRLRPRLTLLAKQPVDRLDSRSAPAGSTQQMPPRAARTMRLQDRSDRSRLRRRGSARARFRAGATAPCPHQRR